MPVSGGARLALGLTQWPWPRTPELCRCHCAWCVPGPHLSQAANGAPHRHPLSPSPSVVAGHRCFLTLTNVPGRSDRHSSLGKGWGRPRRCLPSAPFPRKRPQDPPPGAGTETPSQPGERDPITAGEPRAIPSHLGERHRVPARGAGARSSPPETLLRVAGAGLRCPRSLTPPAPGARPALPRPARARSHSRRRCWRRAGRIGWRAPSLSPGGAGEGSGRCVRAAGARRSGGTARSAAHG